MATRYLSFNSAIPEAFNLDECITEEHSAETPLPLQHRWHVWEQIQRENAAIDRAADYSQNTRDLAAFDTVQTFWQLWSHIPQPSELMGQKRMIRQDNTGTSHVVDALMIFKEGIQPMWEDPLNSTGGHFEFRLSPQHIRPAQMDEYWNNLVLALVGGTIEHSDLINGIRLVGLILFRAFILLGEGEVISSIMVGVDKLAQGRHPCIRLEVWARKCDRNLQEKLARDLEKCFATKLDGTIGSSPRGDWKSHASR
ncbi:eukaryotic translation initiation factor 4e, putative [Eimeria brunetti]|uniref:Eukaryotic translation initiation factor 4e, putative n=1 Tax=Eimeria brunetti TaxID=51314 RepID=U6LV05_9EIME|nr:eukaryotic translation initiation factor 4e, putative [Eimeria brunetti]